MEERNITIPVEEYKKLLEASVRVSVFSDYVNHSQNTALTGRTAGGF